MMGGQGGFMRMFDLDLDTRKFKEWSRKLKTSVAGIFSGDVSKKWFTTIFGHFKKLTKVVTHIGDVLVGSFAAGGAAIQAGMVVASAILSKQLIKINSEMEQFEISLQTTLGSLTAAKQEMAGIVEFAKETPYEIKNVTDAVVKLRAYAMDSGEWLEPLGNAASAFGREITDAVEMAADAVQGMFRRALSYGIRMDREMFKQGGKYAGMTYADALMMELKKRFEGGMELQAKTLKGIWSNIKDTLYIQFQSATEPIFKIIKKEVDNLYKYIGSERGQAQLKSLFITMADYIYKFIEVAKSTFQYFSTNILPSVKTVGEAMVNTFQQVSEMLRPLLEVLPPIVQIFTSIFTFLSKIVTASDLLLKAFIGFSIAIKIMNALGFSVRKLSTSLVASNRAATLFGATVRTLGATLILSAASFAAMWQIGNYLEIKNNLEQIGSEIHNVANSAKEARDYLKEMGEETGHTLKEMTKIALAAKQFGHNMSNVIDVASRLSGKAKEGMLPNLGDFDIPEDDIAKALGELSEAFIVRGDTFAEMTKKTKAAGDLLVNLRRKTDETGIGFKDLSIAISNNAETLALYGDKVEELEFLITEFGKATKELGINLSLDDFFDALKMLKEPTMEMFMELPIDTWIAKPMSEIKHLLDDFSEFAIDGLDSSSIARVLSTSETAAQKILSASESALEAHTKIAETIADYSDTYTEAVGKGYEPPTGGGSSLVNPLGAWDRIAQWFSTNIKGEIVNGVLLAGLTVAALNKLFKVGKRIDQAIRKPDSSMFSRYVNYREEKARAKVLPSKFEKRIVDALNIREKEISKEFADELKKLNKQLSSLEKRYGEGIISKLRKAGFSGLSEAIPEGMNPKEFRNKYAEFFKKMSKKDLKAYNEWASVFERKIDNVQGKIAALQGLEAERLEALRKQYDDLAKAVKKGRIPMALKDLVAEVTRLTGGSKSIFSKVTSGVATDKTAEKAARQTTAKMSSAQVSNVRKGIMYFFMQTLNFKSLPKALSPIRNGLSLRTYRESLYGQGQVLGNINAVQKGSEKAVAGRVFSTQVGALSGRIMGKLRGIITGKVHTDLMSVVTDYETILDNIKKYRPTEETIGAVRRGSFDPIQGKTNILLERIAGEIDRIPKEFSESISHVIVSLTEAPGIRGYVGKGKVSGRFNLALTKAFEKDMSKLAGTIVHEYAHMLGISDKVLDALDLQGVEAAKQLQMLEGPKAQKKMLASLKYLDYLGEKIGINAEAYLKQIMPFVLENVQEFAENIRAGLTPESSVGMVAKKAKPGTLDLYYNLRKEFAAISNAGKKIGWIDRAANILEKEFVTLAKQLGLLTDADIVLSKNIDNLSKTVSSKTAANIFPSAENVGRDAAGRFVKGNPSAWTSETAPRLYSVGKQTADNMLRATTQMGKRMNLFAELSVREVVEDNVLRASTEIGEKMNLFVEKLISNAEKAADSAEKTVAESVTSTLGKESLEKAGKEVESTFLKIAKVGGKTALRGAFAAFDVDILADLMSVLAKQEKVYRLSSGEYTTVKPTAGELAMSKSMENLSDIFWDVTKTTAGAIANTFTLGKTAGWTEKQMNEVGESASNFVDFFKQSSKYRSDFITWMKEARGLDVIDLETKYMDALASGRGVTPAPGTKDAAEYDAFIKGTQEFNRIMEQSNKYNALVAKELSKPTVIDEQQIVDKLMLNLPITLDAALDVAENQKIKTLINNQVKKIEQSTSVDIPVNPDTSNVKEAAEEYVDKYAKIAEKAMKQNEIAKIIEGELANFDLETPEGFRNFLEELDDSDMMLAIGQKALNSYQAEVDGLDISIQDLTASLNEVNIELGEMALEVAKIDKDLVNLNQAFINVSSALDLVIAINNLELVSDRVFQLEGEIADLNVQLSRAESELIPLERALEKATEQFNSVEEAIASAREEFERFMNAPVEGEEEYLNKIYEIDKSISDLQLQKIDLQPQYDKFEAAGLLDSDTFKDWAASSGWTNIEAQIAALEKRRDLEEERRNNFTMDIEHEKTIAQLAEEATKEEIRNAIKVWEEKEPLLQAELERTQEIVEKAQEAVDIKQDEIGYIQESINAREAELKLIEDQVAAENRLADQAKRRAQAEQDVDRLKTSILDTNGEILGVENMISAERLVQLATDAASGNVSAETFGSVVDLFNNISGQINSATKDKTGWENKIAIKNFDAQKLQQDVARDSQRREDILAKMNSLWDVIKELIGHVDISGLSREDLTSIFGENIGMVINAMAANIDRLVNGPNSPSLNQYSGMYDRPTALGGVFTKATRILAGEAGPEAFVPLANGKIPVKISGASGGNNVNNVTIGDIHISVRNDEDLEDIKKAILDLRKGESGFFAGAHTYPDGF